jgi:hypothetical protein
VYVTFGIFRIGPLQQHDYLLPLLVPENRWEGQDEVLGEAIYWNDHWEPLHLSALGPSASTATVVRSSRLREAQATPSTPWLAWKAIVLTRARDYGDFAERQLFGCIPMPV